MALIPTQDVPAVGVDNATFTNASASDTATAGGGVILLVRNTDGAAAKVVTVTTPGTVDGLAVGDIIRTVPITTGLGVIPLLSRLVGAVATIVITPNQTGTSLAVLKVAR